MFFERLQHCCSLAGIKPSALSEIFDTSKSTISAWKRGTSPNSEFVLAAAEYFSVSADYLLGLSDNPHPLSEITADESKLISSLRSIDCQTRDTVLKMVSSVLDSQDQDSGGTIAGANVFHLHDGNARHVDRGIPTQASRKKDSQPVRESPRRLKHVEGAAAAGFPLTAVPEDDVMVPTPDKYVSDEFFIVQARGDSMINAGINNGDYCIFRRDAYHDDGAIVLAHVDGPTDQPDVLIKYLYRRGNKIELRSANPRYKPMLYRSGEVRVTGVLASVVPKSDEYFYS